MDSFVLTSTISFFLLGVDLVCFSYFSMYKVGLCICSRRWPSRPSLGGEALGLAKIICPSRGECQGQEVGVGGLGSRVGGGFRRLSG